MYPNVVFVSGVSDRASMHRVSTRNVGHKMGRYLVLDDTIRIRFSPFLTRSIFEGCS
jgi:hypothetical protein